MKALRWLLLVASVASAQTYYDKTTIAPTGATNTVLGNKTSATAAPTYMAVGTCSTSSSALIWTTNTGFGCNTSINAATLLTGTWAAPGTIGSGTPATGAFTTLSATGQITSTLANGTAPFVVASSTNVANLNASSLSGATFASPGAIGSGTPAAGTFTTLSATAATFPLANVSAASWARVSPAWNIAAFTLNDTTASGTVAQDAAITIQPPVFTSTGGASTTITFPTAFSVGLPTCSGGVVCTTPLAAYFDGATKVNGILITAGATVVGATNINANNNSATNIGTGTTNQNVSIGGTSNTLAVGSAMTVTGLITPTATVGIAGTTGADAPAAGSVGQVVSMHCVVGTAAQAATNVSTPVASPGVVTWTSHTFVPSTGLANYTCPINFTTTGALPTGLAVGTNYFIIGSSVSGDTFQVADTAAHALAGTNAINFTGSTSGQSSAYIGNLGSNGASFTGAGLSLIAGDWDCTALAEYQELTSITSARYVAGVNNAAATIGAIGTFTDDKTVSGIVGAANIYIPSPPVQVNISATTSEFAIDNSTFTGGSMNEGGLLRCRRMR